MAPEFVRNVDPKYRILIPACIARRFGDRARVTLADGVLVIEPAAVGRRVQRVKCGSGHWFTSKIGVPAEFRELSQIRPGARVALAMDGERLLIWALEGGR